MRSIRPYIPVLVLATITVAACSNNPILPNSGPDIKEVYERHVGGGQGAPARPEDDSESDAQNSNPRDPDWKNDSSSKNSNNQVSASGRPLANDRIDLTDYTRTSANEIEQLFPLLPNPQLVLYVYPHLSAKGRPIPGYTTAFRTYERDEYALPGEWIPDHPDAMNDEAIDQATKQHRSEQFRPMESGQ